MAIKAANVTLEEVPVWLFCEVPNGMLMIIVTPLSSPCVTAKLLSVHDGIREMMIAPATFYSVLRMALRNPTQKLT